MNTPARQELVRSDPVDIVAIALAHALARQHHADSLRAGEARESFNAD